MTISPYLRRKARTLAQARHEAFLKAFEAFGAQYETKALALTASYESLPDFGYAIQMKFFRRYQAAQDQMFMTYCVMSAAKDRSEAAIEKARRL